MIYMTDTTGCQQISILFISLLKRNPLFLLNSISLKCAPNHLRDFPLFGYTVSFTFIAKLQWNLSEDALSDNFLVRQPTNSFEVLMIRTARSRSDTGRQWHLLCDCLADSFKMDSSFRDVQMFKKNVLLSFYEIWCVNCFSSNQDFTAACHIHLVYVRLNNFSKICLLFPPQHT